MSKYNIMYAVEYAKLPVKFKKQYPSLQALADAGYWLQRKYDGCFGMAVVKDGCGSIMLSRTGEDYTTSCSHILSELAESARAWGPFDPFVMLGEVWHPDLKFPAISGQFRKAAPSKLRFIANDILPPDLTTDRPYRDRYDDLMKALPPAYGDWFFCSVADTYHNAAGKTPEEWAQTWVAQGGYDGAILRNPEAGYTIGQVKNGEIVKVKPTMSLDLRIKRTTVDVRPTKLGGYITVDLGNDVECDVGTGLTQADLASFQNELARGAWINRIAEVEFMGFTEDGKLREPRFKGLRHDKKEPDR